MKPQLHTSPENPQTEIEWAIYHFRATAFHTAYDRTYRDVADLTTRFALSIIRSAQPIPEYKRSMLLDWYRGRRKGQKRSLCPSTAFSSAVNRD